MLWQGNSESPASRVRVLEGPGAVIAENLGVFSYEPGATKSGSEVTLGYVLQLDNISSSVGCSNETEWIINVLKTRNLPIPSPALVVTDEDNGPVRVNLSIVDTDSPSSLIGPIITALPTKGKLYLPDAVSFNQAEGRWILKDNASALRDVHNFFAAREVFEQYASRVQAVSSFFSSKAPPDSGYHVLFAKPSGVSRVSQLSHWAAAQLRVCMCGAANAYSWTAKLRDLRRVQNGGQMGR